MQMQQSLISDVDIKYVWIWIPEEDSGTSLMDAHGYNVQQL